MKVHHFTIACYALGAIAAPSWAWKEDSIDKHFKATGKDVYYCQSGWESIHKKDKKYMLLMNKGLAKRDQETHDGPDKETNDGPDHKKHERESTSNTICSQTLHNPTNMS